MFKKTVLIVIILITMLSFKPADGVYNNTEKIDYYQKSLIKINSDIESLMNQVNESILYRYIENFTSFGYKKAGSENASRVEKYIFDEFDKMGLFVYMDPWNYIKYKDNNVVAIQNGTDPNSDVVILLCAHFDTIGDSPGANDDGSGIAALLTIANICSQHSFNHTIRFLAFSAEEVGLYGSHDYARKAYDRNENIFAVMNIDTIGNTTEEGKDLVYLLKPERSEWISNLIKNLSDTYKEKIRLSTISIGNRGNDHKSFHNYGYDTIQFVQLARGDYPTHKPQDTIEKINFEYLSKVTKLILATTVNLANKQIDLQVKIVTPKEGYLYVFDLPILKQPKFNIGGKNNRGMTYIIGRTTARINITTNEEINIVGYSIDGIMSHSGFFQNFPYEWKIEISSKKFFPLIGKHTLGVYVVTTNGKVSYDEMDIFVLSIY